MEKHITYPKIEQDLLEIDALTEPAETHGIMCGFICAGANETDRHWMKTVLNEARADDPSTSENLANLLELYQQSFMALQDINLEIELLLPDDSDDLKNRAKALTQWCQGFLSGIALGSGTLTHADPDIEEILTDLSEISKLNIAKLNGSEEEEQQFVELTEHVRMSTLLLHTLLQTPQHSKPH